ncbi:MAG: hypothetical protein WBM90_02765 [Acidimicrobiia bacterium]
MTDHEQGSESWEPREADPPRSDGSSSDGIAGDEATDADSLSDFTSGEGMVALSGLLLLGVWLIFEVITRQYSISTLAIVLAAAAAILPRINPESVGKIMPLSHAMKVLGYALAVVGIVEVITDIRIGIYDDVAAVLGALIAYAAYALAFVGARSIEI